MMQALTQSLTDKKIVILGFGREGQSTLRFLDKYVQSSRIQIMDSNVSHVGEVLSSLNVDVEVYSKDRYLDFDDDVDLIFKSPGIPLKQLEGHVDLEKITSQSHLFIRTFKEIVIGITGTKGKSTTCTFLYELMKKAGIHVTLVGNIGKPAFDYIEPDSMPDYFIYELSSHQLETAGVSPHIGVVLNLFEEHLDHYHSYDHYAEAKLNIGRFQSSEDYFIYSALSDALPKRVEQFEGNMVAIRYKDPLVDAVEAIEINEPRSVMAYDETIWVNEQGVSTFHNDDSYHYAFDEKRALKGNHNLINMMVAFKVTQLLGYDIVNGFESLMASFSGLPHRLAYVNTVDGIAFYNDSISTIPQATIVAVEAINNVQSVIIGGMDRGIDYKPLIDFVNEHPELKFILLPGTGHDLEKDFNDKGRLFKVESMDEAVNCALTITDKNKSCLLSPAAPSYGYYKNFEERGEVFEQIVNRIIE